MINVQLSQHFIKPRVLAGKYNKHWKWAWIIIISIINQHNNVKIKSWVKVHYLFKIHGVAKYTE